MSITEGMRASPSIAEHMLQQRINELEAQIIHIKSATINTMIDIRIAAEEEDYDEIISICELWGAKDDGTNL